MDKYLELCANGLDLISFILVTPELIRAFGPIVVPLMKLLMLAVLAATAGIAFWIDSGWIVQTKDTFTQVIYFVLGLGGSVLWIVGVFVLFERFINSAFAKHAFGYGVATFLIARSLIFVSSILHLAD